MVSNSYYANAFARDHGLRQTPIVFNPVALYFAAAPGDPLELLPAIDAHLEAWRHNEDSIYYRALQAAMVPAQEAVVPPMLRYLLLGSLGVVVAFLILSALLRRQVRQRTAELRRSNRRLDHMLDSSPVVLYQLAFDGTGVTGTRWVSHNVQRLFGFDPAEFVDQDLWRRQLHPEDRDTVLANLRALPERQHLVQEYRILDASGRVRFVRDEMQLQPASGNAADQALEIVGSWNDLTETHEQAERLTFLTHYDPLTGLPNRALLRERLTHAIHRARREDTSLALLHLDIDRFKSINESFGQHQGDRVLRVVAARLADLQDGSGILARTGGNGFVMLLEDIGGRQAAAAQARRALKRFAEPIDSGGQELALTLSVGIALFGEDGTDADALLQHAEVALFEAKQSGRNSYRFYSSALSAGVAERVGLESALRGAVTRGELLLHYQPQIDLDTRELVGVEALVRWQHPELGLVPPGRFIPVAEEMGII
ncbi:MAG TPA: diguanylate cyclase, partial [Wenzhouxiangella sp.]|nr:diguanylate cyclase [Wenzhouxiangella sp.]